MFDVAYYLRGVATAITWTVYSRLASSTAINAHILRANLVSPCRTWGLCWFSDLDIMFHMNNARYLRECDFARYKFLISCGLGPALRRTGYTMVLGQKWMILIVFCGPRFEWPLIHELLLS